MLAVAARQWWVLVLQGVLGIAVGILALVYPDIALGTIALLFAFWTIVSGASQLAAGWRVAEQRGRSWPFLLSGAVSVIAGVAYHNRSAYAGKGGAGWGVRLLVELARGEPAAPDIH